MTNRAFPIIAVITTLLSIVSILLVLLPGLVKQVPEDLWLVTADITGLNKNVIPTLHVDPTVAKALAWGDYVSIGLWNACTRHMKKDTNDIRCTEPSISYSFDPAALWAGASKEPVKADITLPQKVLKTLDTQSKNTLLIKIFFIAGLGLSVICLVTGSVGACSGRRTRNPALKQRMLGLTALISLISTIVLICGAGVATNAYKGLLDVMNPSFGEFINFKLGQAAIGMLWLSALISLVSFALYTHSWRKEHRYRRQQGVKGQASFTKVGVEVHVDEVPSGEGYGDKDTLLQKDTSYHSPTHK